MSGVGVNGSHINQKIDKLKNDMLDEDSEYSDIDVNSGEERDYISRNDNGNSRSNDMNDSNYSNYKPDDKFQQYYKK